MEELSEKQDRLQTISFTDETAELKDMRTYNVFLKMPFLAISCFIHYYYIYRGLRRVIIIKNNNYNTTSFPNDEDRNAFMI